jgi:hypothetical protein
MKVLFNYFFSQLESYNAARLDQLSAVYHDASAEFDGGDHLLEGGFSLIINALAKVHMLLSITYTIVISMHLYHMYLC